jgi:hypothetical protein
MDQNCPKILTVVGCYRRMGVNQGKSFEKEERKPLERKMTKIGCGGN